MYLAMIILLMGALPIASIAVEFAAHGGPDVMSLIGRWFVFWAVGVRLILAGLRQVADPKFTAGTIFGVKDQAALTIVQELGFGNLSIGTLGALSLIHREWIAPAALAGGLFYGLAGVKHALRHDRNAIENIATASDLFIFVVLAGYLAAVFLRAE
jgi:hypothetical protein